MEAIFTQEREDWQMSVKQMQQSVDKAFQEVQRSKGTNKDQAGK
jgi:hypothetical protein